MGNRKNLFTQTQTYIFRGKPATSSALGIMMEVSGAILAACTVQLLTPFVDGAVNFSSHRCEICVRARSLTVA